MKTRTNFQITKDVISHWKEHYGKTIERGVITVLCMDYIRNISQLDKMTYIEVNDLRDFIVLFLSTKQDLATREMQELYDDCRSAVTHVIDDYLYKMSLDQ